MPNEAPWNRLLLSILAGVVVLTLLGMGVAHLAGAPGGLPELIQTSGCWGLMVVLLAPALLIGFLGYLFRRRRRNRAG